MNKILSALGVAALLLALAGCSAEGRQETNDAKLSVQSVQMPDGRTVTCIIYHAPYKGGLSCDW